MLSMVFFAGFMGLPYMENMRQLVRQASRIFADHEYDLEYGLRESLNGVLNPWMTDVVLHGAFSRLTGVDFRRRIGVGEPIPFNLMQGNLIAATGPAGSLAVDALGRIVEAV